MITNLTLKIGVRYDQVTMTTTTVTGRRHGQCGNRGLGVAWDITGDAKNILRGNWGRFMHPNDSLPDVFATTEQTVRIPGGTPARAPASVPRHPVASAEDCAGVCGLGFGLPAGQPGMGPVRLGAPSDGSLRHRTEP